MGRLKIMTKRGVYLKVFTYKGLPADNKGSWDSISGYDEAMHLLLPVVLVFALVFGPGWWVRNVMSRYSSPEDRYDGTGGELARHLLDSHDLQHIKVEETPKGLVKMTYNKDTEGNHRDTPLPIPPIPPK